MTEKNEKNECNASSWCLGLRNICDGQSQGMSKGLCLQPWIHLKTGESYTIPVYRKKTGNKATTVTLRFCPACGKNIVEILKEQGRFE
jgi:hypothetical protein